MTKKLTVSVIAVLIVLHSYINTYADEVHLTDIPEEYLMYAWECECEFDISKELLLSLCWQESKFQTEHKKVGGNVTQITNEQWFKEGIDYCEADNVKGNVYQNMRVCAYYLKKWSDEAPGDVYLWLMQWNMGYEKAKRIYRGNGNRYARQICERAERFEEEWNLMNLRKP